MTDRHTSLHVAVHGTPAPQGSLRAFLPRGTRRPVITADNVHTRPWKDLVRDAAITATRQASRDPWQPYPGPVDVQVVFVMPRPKSHWRTGANTHLLRSVAPEHHTVKPDVDKLLRAILDALTEAAVWIDDAQVVQVTTRKHWAHVETPGAYISVAPAGIHARGER